jgi:hypothetical protein
MSNPGSWQAMQNASRATADAARRGRQAAEDSRRITRRRGSGSMLGNLIALLIFLAVLAFAAPIAVDILAHVGLAAHG